MPQALASSPLIRARLALAASSIPDLRHLKLEKTDDAVRIEGRVVSFYHKQLAQEIVLTEIVEWEVVNAIIVG